MLEQGTSGTGTGKGNRNKRARPLASFCAVSQSLLAMPDTSWRTRKNRYLRTAALARVPNELETLVLQSHALAWKTVFRLLSGQPYVPILPDGRQGEPKAPSQELQLKAAKFAIERLEGATPTRGDLDRLDDATVDSEALSDAELERELLDWTAKRALGGNTSRPDGVEAPAPALVPLVRRASEAEPATDAELVDGSTDDR